MQPSQVALTPPLLPHQVRLQNKARPFQLRMSSELHNIHFNLEARHAYLQAPGGVGKTFLCFMYGEMHFPGDLKVLLTPTKKLANQHQRTLEDLQDLKLVSRDWQVMTWQALLRKIKNNPRYPKIGLLAFDECHNGGTKDSGYAYREILSVVQPCKYLLLSATNWNINETSLGKREGYISLMSFQEAYQQKLLHPVVLNRVDIPLDLKHKIKEIEDLTGASFEDLKDQAPDQLEKLIQSRNCNIKSTDIMDICKRRIDTMVALYESTYYNRPAIFYVSNLELCQYAKQRLGKVESAIIATSRPSRETDRDIEHFLSGKIRVAVSCKMLIEGFDFPDLDLAFDCNFNPRNVRATVQKICRLTRLKSANQLAANYFYCVDSMVTRLDPSTRLIADNYSLHSGLTDLVPETAVQISLQQQLQRDQAIIASELDATLSNAFPPSRVINVGKLGTRIARSYFLPVNPEVPLESQVPLEDLLDRNQDLLDPRNQTTATNRPSTLDSLSHEKVCYLRAARSGITADWDYHGERCKQFTTPGSDLYDAYFATHLKKTLEKHAPITPTPHTADPLWQSIVTLSRMARQESIGLRMLLQGLPEDDVLEAVIKDPFTNMRMDLLQEIARHKPKWLPHYLNESTVAILRRIFGGGRAPSWRSSPQLALDFETLWEGYGPGSTLEAFVRAHVPSWLEDRPTQWDRDQGMERLLRYDHGASAPALDTKLGAFFKKQLIEHTSIAQEMRNLHPSWFDRRTGWPRNWQQHQRSHADEFAL